jgi:hypothetical protein
MQRVAARPVLIDVIAEILHHFRNLMRTNGTVAATADFDVGGPPVPRIGTDPFQCYPMQMKQLRRPKAELAIRMQEVFDHLNDCVELSKPVKGFPLSKQVRVSD